MSKTIFSGPQIAVVEVLIEARKKVGLKQSELAARIGRDQSFISLIEIRQRRVDIVEFITISKALRADPLDLLAEILKKMEGAD